MDLSRGISDSFFQDGNKLIFNDKTGPIPKWGGAILASQIWLYLPTGPHTSFTNG